MNPFYTAMHLANLIVELSAKNENFLDHFRDNIRYSLREAVRDHEDALVQQQVTEQDPTKRLCPECRGRGVIWDKAPYPDCARCNGTGWEDIDHGIRS